jgi:hypothetical protein
MAGKHRLKGHRVQRTSRTSRRHRPVEVVDVRTLTTHFLTLDALAAGRLPKGRYSVLCGQDVLPANLVEPGLTAVRPVSRFRVSNPGPAALGRCGGGKMGPRQQVPITS